MGIGFLGQQGLGPFVFQGVWHFLPQTDLPQGQSRKNTDPTEGSIPNECPNLEEWTQDQQPAMWLHSQVPTPPDFRS
jgi:hypothetical protein